jgi:hypothetical protein
MAARASSRHSRTSRTGRIVCMHRASRAGWGVAGDPPAGSQQWFSRDSGLPSPTFLQRPDFGYFQHVVAGLREFCPAAYPVVVRTSSVPANVEGFAKRNENRFVIHLDRNLTEVAAVNVLIHEWAHCVAWNLLVDRAIDEYSAGKLTWPEFERACHDAAFGVAFAAVWRAYTTNIIDGHSGRRID